MLNKGLGSIDLGSLVDNASIPTYDVLSDINVEDTTLEIYLLHTESIISRGFGESFY